MNIGIAGTGRMGSAIAARPRREAVDDYPVDDYRLPLESRGALVPSTPVNPKMVRKIPCGPR